MFELRRRAPSGWGVIALTLFLVVMLTQASCRRDEEYEDTGATDLATTGEPTTEPMGTDIVTTEPMGTDTTTTEPMGTDVGGTPTPAAGRNIQVVGVVSPQLAWKVTIDGVAQTGTTIAVKVGDKITWTTGGGRHGVRFVNANCNAAKAIITFNPALQSLGGSSCGTPGSTSGPFTVGTVTAKPTSTLPFECTVHGSPMSGSIVAAP